MVSCPAFLSECSTACIFGQVFFILVNMFTLKRQVMVYKNALKVTIYMAIVCNRGLSQHDLEGFECADGGCRYH